MTDKELKNFFESIKDFNDFNTKVINRQDIILKDGFSVLFHDNLLPKTIEITVDWQKHSFDDLTFSNIIKDIRNEKDILDREEVLRQEKIIETELRNEIFCLEENVYKVHDEYIEHMLFASDIASAHGVYLKKLQDMLALFNRENILFINEHKISSKTELKDYLKSVGFHFIDKDA